MSSIVQNILERTIGDGARATKFELFFEFTNPDSAPTAEDVLIMAKTTSFPGKTHETIDFKYKGRSIPIKGQIKYTQSWECTFHLTQDHLLKNAFENWIEALDQKHNYMDPTTQAHLTTTQKKHSTNKNYTTTIKIYQRDFDDENNTAVYTLYNVFPTEIAPVQYSYESVGQVQEFSVTFSYSYFTLEVLKGKEGNFIDVLYGKLQDASKALVTGTLATVGNAINGFVKDSVGDTLNELNSWAKGDSKDTSPQITSKKDDDAISGGLGPDHMDETIHDRVHSSAGQTN